MKTTAKAWDKIYLTRGAYRPDPHPDVERLARTLQGLGANTILDLGCGCGRHVRYFARQGFTVSGLDNSASGLRIARRWLLREHLKARLVQQEMSATLPWNDSFFDAVIATAVIHHADIHTIKKIIAEIERVLKKHGIVFIQVPKLQNQATTYEQIEPRTFVPLDGEEKGLPHHYFTSNELKECFSNFHITDIHLDEWSHYCLSAYKR